MDVVMTGKFQASQICLEVEFTMNTATKTSEHYNKRTGRRKAKPSLVSHSAIPKVSIKVSFSRSFLCKIELQRDFSGLHKDRRLCQLTPCKFLAVIEGREWI